MSVLVKIATVVFLLFFLFTAPSSAEIKSFKIRSDNRPMILFEKFGFTNTGNITVAISAVSVNNTVSPLDRSRLGFFLLGEESLIQAVLELEQNPNFCIIDSKFISLLFTFRDLPSLHQSSFNKSYLVTYSSEYSLFFVNCVPNSLVTMDVRTELFNTDDGATKDYLSSGLTHLPYLYFIFSLIYLCFLGFWICVCFKNKRSVHHVHLLMSLLLTMKALSLFCAAEDNHHVKVTGYHHNGWNVLYYMFHFINGVFLYTLIVLIGAGWSYIKSILQRKEKIVLMLVISLQVLANLATVVIRENGPYIEDWVTWNQMFFLIDIICCCAIIFPIVWSIRSFSKTDRKAARVFRLFCVVVLGYLIFTRIGVFVLKIIVSYKNQWVSSAAEEMCSLVFCLVMFYMFRPAEEYEEIPQMAKG
ncbi:hypothetical protein R6Q57_016939 [Mikania cordata]